MPRGKLITHKNMIPASSSRSNANDHESLDAD